MTAPTQKKSVVRFGNFTANLGSGELWNNGFRIRLQTQPFQILEAFLERPNELITREELQRKVWPSDTFVDFEQGLNKAINKLRDALRDTADTPRFIETVPKRGYRFIASIVVEDPPTPVVDEPPLPAPASPTAAPLAPESGIGPPQRSKPMRWALIGIAAVALMAALITVWRHRAAVSTDLHSVAVLPLSAQGDKTEYDLADGITDSIINDLSLVPNLRVISHASVFEYRDHAVEPRTVGIKLGVDAVLTGRLEQAGNNLTETSLPLQHAATNSFTSAASTAITDLPTAQSRSSRVPARFLKTSPR